MPFYAVLSDSPCSPKLQRVCERAGERLGRKLTLHTTTESGFNVEMLRAHQGDKFSFAREPGWDGITVNVEAASGQIRTLARKSVPGWLKMNPIDKQISLRVLCCLYGLEGCNTSNKALFVLTHLPRNLDTYLPTKLSRYLGFNVVNLATTEGSASLVRILSKL